MALMDLVPRLLIAKHPGLGSVSSSLTAAGVLPFSTDRRSSRALQCCLLLSSLVVTSWASNAEAQTPTRGRTAKTAPQKAEDAGGNPPSYEVFGKRYKVRTSSDGYQERGIASWYGNPFHGRPTSSGDMYDMHEMTAAHTSLPLPTWVEVTNLSNGKSVVVKVNDRGPFVANRVIDLSYGAAKALDIVQAGTARVEIRALGARPKEPTAQRPETAARQSNDRARTSTADARVAVPTPVEVPSAPAKPPPESLARPTPQPPPTAQEERLFAQAGKFTSRADAVDLVDELKAQGLVNAFVVTEDGRRKSVHRVRVGLLLDEAEVERMSDRLRGLGAKRSRSVVMN
jgi:rare lipoprotein A